MLQYLGLAAFVVSSASQAAPVANKKTNVDEALNREQRIKNLSKAPPRLYHICGGGSGGDHFLRFASSFFSSILSFASTCCSTSALSRW